LGFEILLSFTIPYFKLLHNNLKLAVSSFSMAANGRVYVP
jgi:hypothetical protein